MRHWFRWLAASALIVAGACDSDDDGPPVGPSPSPPACVSFTDLGTWDKPPSRANGVNEVGQIVGIVRDRAFVWSDGEMTLLPTLGGSSAEAMAIDDAGWVVGFSYTPHDSAQHAFLWRDGVMIDLGTLGGTVSEALDINNAGWVVGASTLAGDSTTHPFLWRNGAMIDLAAPESRNSRAHGINELGQVVGVNDSGAFVWQGGTSTLLPGANAVAHDINESGQIAGMSEGHVVMWEAGAMVVLDSIDPFSGENATAFAIDDLGRVVGSIEQFAGWRAFVWRRNAPRVMLEGIGAPEAFDINAAGLVVGRNVPYEADEPEYALVWDLNCSPP